MREATRSAKGKCYVSFFQLTIGMERLMKTVLIVDHMVNNSMLPPTEKFLKDLGHRLDKLAAEVRKVDAGVTPHPLDRFQTGTLEHDIISFLSVFADRTRYHNLNKLVLAPSAQAFDDPLEAWGRILLRTLKDDVKHNQIQKIVDQSNAMAAAMGGLVLVIANDLDQSPMTLQQLLGTPLLQAEAAKYVVWHVSEVLKAMADCLSHVSHQAFAIDDPAKPSVPDMREFCVPFLPLSKTHTLSKKRWP
jgi:hypothetical protein